MHQSGATRIPSTAIGKMNYCLLPWAVGFHLRALCRPLMSQRSRVWGFVVLYGGCRRSVTGSCNPRSSLGPGPDSSHPPPSYQKYLGPLRTWKSKHDPVLKERSRELWANVSTKQATKIHEFGVQFCHDYSHRQRLEIMHTQYTVLHHIGGKRSGCCLTSLVKV